MTKARLRRASLATSVWGVSAFRDDFINTGDNDLEVGRWWDVLIYIAFPILFFVLMASYFSDMIANTPNVWDPPTRRA